MRYKKTHHKISNTRSYDSKSNMTPLVSCRSSWQSYSIFMTQGLASGCLHCAFAGRNLLPLTQTFVWKSEFEFSTNNVRIHLQYIPVFSLISIRFWGFPLAYLVKTAIKHHHAPFGDSIRSIQWCFYVKRQLSLCYLRGGGVFWRLKVADRSLTGLYSADSFQLRVWTILAYISTLKHRQTAEL